MVLLGPGPSTSANTSSFDLRSQVSLVSQDVVLFNDTIRNNIAFNAVDKTAGSRSRRRRARRT